MKKRIFAAAMVLCMLLTGCGGGASTETATDMMSFGTYAVAPEAAPKEMVEMMDSAVVTVQGSGTDKGAQYTGGQVYQDPNAKLIRRANLNIQTTEFDMTVEKLYEMVSLLGGYFQNAAFHGGSYRNVNANRTGEYMIRIPAEKYDQFMSQAGDLGYVTYRNESTENIGEQYYDTEARLKTQKTKQDRLLVLLEKAETMEDIISLESALSEVEYQIEQLSSTLNRYDSLVGFATIELNLHEVHKVTEETGVTNSLGQRMRQGFSSSVDNLIDGAQNFMVWISYNFFGIVILVAVVFLGGKVVAVVVRRRKQKRLKNQNKEDN